MRTAMAQRIGRHISAIGLGCWQLGGDWGDTDEQRSQDILHAAADAGTTFFDTADGYGDGRSEQSIGQFLKDRDDSDSFFVATKMGRRLPEQTPEGYNLDNYRRWTDRSRENLGVDTLDLVQLHCPPSAVFHDPQTFEDLRTLKQEGRIADFGVSVELVEDALHVIGEDDLASVQIIFNIFRRKPAEHFLREATEKGVAVISRVPLASGLLSGKYDEHTTFAANDHRNYNRDGSAFDVGETFAGVPFPIGVEAARKVAELTPEGWTTAQLALRWVEQMGSTTVIPGARTPEQARQNAAVGDLPTIPDETMAALAKIYNEDIREHVHSRW
ncbi:aldo/keto reductase [Demequina zhanjiangensis]|uniref:Aldo/keto reductase n=1 Tax=Demequina zhanjiangensis TaxID=3051659 RepID=A0ABT8FYP2_9MICO|nr:aldo/keto reductase [Demequina sp. SYSU T00b26]MDN4471942.1 aldo/keto reductase [Demequina sp. SYSU T00b26]